MYVLNEVRAFLQLSEQIGTAGQPTVAQFAQIQAAGYDLVINLARVDSPGAIADEATTIAQHNMQYIHIPVGWETPTLENLQQFFEVMDAHPDHKIFIHCAANKRVSVFMYLDRILRQGWSVEAACQDLHRVWHPNPCWQQFITTAIKHSSKNQRQQPNGVRF